MQIPSESYSSAGIGQSLLTSRNVSIDGSSRNYGAEGMNVAISGDTVSISFEAREKQAAEIKKRTEDAEALELGSEVSTAISKRKVENSASDRREMDKLQEALKKAMKRMQDAQKKLMDAQSDLQGAKTENEQAVRQARVEAAQAEVEAASAEVQAVQQQMQEGASAK